LNTAIIYKEANAELIARCKKGDHKAFKDVYELYSKSMFNVCVRMLNSRDEAEDTLQDSFISAFNNIKQYSDKASFGSWLKRIVVNKCIDVIRKKNTQLLPIDEAELAEVEVEEESIVYDIESVKEGISRLPDGYRVILTLYLFEDFSHSMIAEKLNISEGTSKSQYSRARKKLVELITLNKKKDVR
jgi:RNA polymerase sigma factor (sigma-70 family)